MGSMRFVSILTSPSHRQRVCGCPGRVGGRHGVDRLQPGVRPVAVGHLARRGRRRGGRNGAASHGHQLQEAGRSR